MNLGFIDFYEGNVPALTTEQWQALDTNSTLTQAPEDSDNCPHIHTENVPESFTAHLDELIKEHHNLWDGSLGLIKTTEHRIKLKTGAKPVLFEPVSDGAPPREKIREQVDKMT